MYVQTHTYINVQIYIYTHFCNISCILQNLISLKSDFKPMVKTLLFIGLAFFYLDFIIPILADGIFLISATKLGIIFSIQMLDVFSIILLRRLTFNRHRKLDTQFYLFKV